jgi:hypothetical protein
MRPWRCAVIAIDMPMPGGESLRASTRGDVLEAAAYFKALAAWAEHLEDVSPFEAQTFARMARFLERLAEEMRA